MNIVTNPLDSIYGHVGIWQLIWLGVQRKLNRFNALYVGEHWTLFIEDPSRAFNDTPIFRTQLLCLQL